METSDARKRREEAKADHECTERAETCSAPVADGYCCEICRRQERE